MMFLEHNRIFLSFILEIDQTLFAKDFFADFNHRHIQYHAKNQIANDFLWNFIIFFMFLGKIKH